MFKKNNTYRFNFLMYLRWVVLTGILSLCLSQESLASIPFQINIQGQVTDTTGNPVPDGNYTFTFNLYATSAGSTTAYIYTESTSNYPVQSGIFSYLLGTNNALTLPFGVPYWLGVQFNNDPEMTPRQEIVSVGNAYKAWNSDSAGIAVYAIVAGTASTANNATNAINATNANSATFAFTASTATTLISASNILGGTLANTLLDPTVALLTANQNYTGINTFGVVTATDTWSLVTVQSASSTKNIWVLDTVNAPYVNATVNYAITAGSVTSATNAVFAYTASTSSTAIYALVAGNASTANNATNAINATNANSATFAFTASTATTLISASNILGGTLANTLLDPTVSLLTANQNYTGINTFGVVTATDTWSLVTVQSASSTKNIWVLDTVNAPYVNATVNYAITAGNVTSATNAVFAYTASTSSTAIYALVAGNASTADNATNAINATNANSATFAFTASTATTLISASNILGGTLANTLLDPTVALLTANQNYTGINTFGVVTATDTWSLITVQSASSTKNIWVLDTVNAPYVNATVNYAITAGSVTSATNAVFAYTASTSSTAIYALVAGNASTADNATNAVNATNANSATFAFTASTATTLISASNILGGTLANTLLDPTVALLTANQNYTGINTFGVVTATDTWSLVTVQSASSTKNIWVLDTVNAPYVNATVNYAITAGSVTSATNAVFAYTASTSSTAIFAYTASTATTLISAANISGGTLADARLSSNVPFLNANQTFTGINVLGIVTANNTWSLTTIQSGLSTKYIWATDTLNGPTYIISTVAYAYQSGTTSFANGNAIFAYTASTSSTAIFSYTASTATTLTSAANIAGGTLADARLSTNVPLLNANNTFSVANYFYGVTISSNWSPSQETSLVVQGSSNGSGWPGMMSIGGNGQVSVSYGGIGAGLFGGIGANSGGSHTYQAGPGGAGAYLSGGQGGINYGGGNGNGGVGLIVLGGYDSSTTTRSSAIQATGNITLGTGYTVDGVDVSQQNATWLGSTASQTLTAASFYDVVTSVNYVNGGVNVAWSAPFTQPPSITSGILNSSYSTVTSYDVQWTYSSSTVGTFRVNYHTGVTSGEAATNAVTVMIHTIGK